MLFFWIFYSSEIHEKQTTTKKNNSNKNTIIPNFWPVVYMQNILHLQRDLKLYLLGYGSIEIRIWGNWEAQELFSWTLYFDIDL